jgi:outer membrane protein assembly factor BamB
MRRGDGFDRVGGGRVAVRFWPAWPLLLVLCLLCVSAVKPSHAARQATTVEFVPTFSTNARVKQDLDRLQRLGNQKQWDEWLGLYQRLIDDEHDLVVERDKEFLVGLRYHCHQLLAALPAPVRQRYRAVYDVPARQLYDKSAAESDARGMQDVYSRYRFSSHASRALLWIANRSLDEGRPEIARVAYSRLAKDPGVTVPLLLRYALAADAAGKPVEAAAVLDRVRREFGVQPVKIGGQELGGSAAADLLSRGLKGNGPAPAARGWTAFAGAGGDRRMPPSATGRLKRLWEYSYSAAAGGYRPGSGIVVYVPPSRSRFNYLSFPVSDGERLWVQGPRNVAALDLKTGQRLWDKQGFVLSPDEAPSENSNPRTGGVWLPTGRPVQAAPSVDGHLLVTRLPYSVGGQDGTYWPADFAVTAFDARTGKQLWRKIAGGDPRGMFFNVPAARSGTVLTGIATYKGGITEYNAVALDGKTGEPLWNTYLGAGSDTLHVTDGSPAAVRDGLVWIESSLHTLNALDLLTGEIRLIYRYKPVDRTIYRGLDTSPPLSNEPLSLIAAGSGPVVFAPRWGTHVIALDPASGKLLWSSPKGAGGSPVGVLFAAGPKHAYICGNHIQAIGLAEGAPEWTWDPDTASSNIGYAALAGDRIYATLENKIYVLSAADGRELEVLDVSDVLGEASGFASIVALDKMLLVSIRDRLVAFGPQ